MDEAIKPKRVIDPSPGRQVWFYGYPYDTNFSRPGDPRQAFRRDSERPLPATVVYVWNDRMVDLDVIDHKGQHFFMTSVKLRQPDDATPFDSIWAEWMPYQISVASK